MSVAGCRMQDRRHGHHRLVNDEQRTERDSPFQNCSGSKTSGSISHRARSAASGGGVSEHSSRSFLVEKLEMRNALEAGEKVPTAGHATLNSLHGTTVKGRSFTNGIISNRCRYIYGIIGITAFPRKTPTFIIKSGAGTDVPRCS